VVFREPDIIVTAFPTHFPVKASVPLALALAALSFLPARAQILADFETNLAGAEFGRFTVALDFSFAPYAVANFIRLAEGLTPWIGAGGLVKTGPFYDGLTYHAATPGLEIVSGSPSGNGTDGPGYLFRDDFRSAPSLFSIYMENDGPNTNGSRFFISKPALPPGAYSRFGVVINPTNPLGGNGRFTVENISIAAPGLVTIETVKLRYLDADAVNFRLAVEDPNHPVLFRHPTARAATFTFRRLPGRIFLDWDDTTGSIALLWRSTDLRSWSGPLTVGNVPGGIEFGYDLTSSIIAMPVRYFRGGVAEYPDWPSTGRPLAGNTIQTFFSDPATFAFTTVYNFDHTAMAGTYLSPLGSGTFTVTSSRVLGPYATELELTPTSGPQPTYRFTLHYDLTWTTTNPVTALPLTANPSRLEGFNLADPGTPLQRGRWTWVRRP